MFNLTPSEIERIFWSHDLAGWTNRKADAASMAYKEDVRKYIHAITKNIEAFYGIR